MARFAPRGEDPRGQMRFGSKKFSDPISPIQTLVGGSIDVAAIGGPAGVDAKLAGADTVYVAIPVNRVIVFTVAGPQVQRVEELPARASASRGSAPSRIFLRGCICARTAWYPTAM